MFGNKQKNKEPEVDVAVESIPAEFYGGVNPTVSFRSTKKEVELSTGPTVLEKRAFDKRNTVGSGSKFHPANLLTSPKFLLLTTLVLFVLFGAGAGIYYWQKLRNTQVSVKNPFVTSTTGFTQTELTEATTTVTTTIEEVTTTPLEEVNPVSIFDIPPTYPSVMLGQSIDTDNDGLSDVAEELFLTDLGVPDSDEDKYTDSHEIYNLYNPIGAEPRKLIDSDLVTEFINPTFEYKVYYPKNWAVGNVDESYQDVLFSTLTGESVEIRAIDKSVADTSFTDWFAKWAPNEKISDLVEFETVFKDKGWQRKDNLVYYFETPRRVYVMLYHTTDSNVVNFEMVIKMMARSFRLPTTEEVLPNLVVEESGVETVVTTTQGL